jgi:hypothetical protein
MPLNMTNICDGAPAEPDERPIIRLITALRSPLPEGFRWNFQHAAKCALGLAIRIGVYDAVQDFRLTLPTRSGDPFSVPEGLNPVVPLYGVPAPDVTPAMVADALEKLITGGDALERLTARREC